MKFDHEAVRKAYPNVVTIRDDDGAYDENDKSVNLDQSKIDVARVELNKLNYQKQRTGTDEAFTTDTIYLPVEEQLDMQYWDLVNGTTTWKDHVAAVKAKYPKPS
tara:strand:+ start:587 stop:901 length:315 start_codon:yes stop_codon:yes gene_type:complete